jgi:hypothetical protein
MVKNLTENTAPVTSPKPPIAAGADPRIDEVEKDVKKLKTDVDNFMALKNTVEDLKNTIVDIRSLISEAQSPFNLLQFITNEDDLNKVVQAKPLIEKKLQGKKEEETKTEITASAAATPGVAPAACEEEKTGFTVESTVETKEALLPDDPEKPMPLAPPENIMAPPSLNKSPGNLMEGIGTLSDGTSIVDWVYTMLDLGFDEEGIRKICEYCEFSSLMPKGYSEHVSNLVGAVIKARSMKLTPEEVILSMYGAADAAGTRTNPKDLTTLIMRVLKKNKTGGS